MLRFLLLFCVSFIIVSSSPTAYFEEDSTYDLESSETRQLLERLGKEFNVSVNAHNISDETAQLLFKMNSYCSCACCQEAVFDEEDDSQDECDRKNPVKLPNDFRCSRNLCLANANDVCKAWDQAKCNRACFCQRCKAQLTDPNDNRCQGEHAHLLPGPKCDCSSIKYPPACTPEPPNLKALWLVAALVSQNPQALKCLFGCFCVGCDTKEVGMVIPNIDLVCSRYTSIPKENCTCPSCPTRRVAEQAQQNIAALRVSHAVHGR